MRRKAARMVSVVGVLLALLAGDLSSASASVPTNYCDPHSYTYVVKNYTRGNFVLPLRCGIAASNWGFRHLVDRGRWDPTFDSYIALTFSRGEYVHDLQNDGGDNIFALFDDGCNELFRIIYNSRAYNGNGVSPQGIITAYYRTYPPTLGSYRMHPANADYRTDCPVIQNI